MNPTGNEGEMPTSIFGLGASRHKNKTIRMFLKSRRIRGFSILIKSSLLQELRKIEHAVSPIEAEVIAKWFRGCEVARHSDGNYPDVSTIIEEIDTEIFRKKEDVHHRRTYARAGHQARQERMKAKARNDRRVPNSQPLLESDTEDESEIGSLEDTISDLVDAEVDIDSSRECCICTETFGLDDFPEISLASSCNHQVSSCISCVSMSIDSQIPDVSWDQIKCTECPGSLPYDTIKKYASAESFEAYDKKSLLALISAMPTFAMCLNPACGSGQIHDRGEDEPIMTCKDCSFKTCFVHRTAWHEGRTCVEYDAETSEELREQEEASAELIATTATICPNSACGIPITKISGCDHMTCRACRHQFCYVCRAPWINIVRQSNTGHEEYCRYHTNNLVVPRLVMPVTPHT